MITAERNQLLANGASTVGLPFAYLGVLHHSLHLLTRRQSTVGISALARVNEGVDATLNRQLACLLESKKTLGQRLRLGHNGYEEADISLKNEREHSTSKPSYRTYLVTRHFCMDAAGLHLFTKLLFYTCNIYTDV